MTTKVSVDGHPRDDGHIKLSSSTNIIYNTQRHNGLRQLKYVFFLLFFLHRIRIVSIYGIP